MTIRERLAELDRLPAEEPTEEELAAIAKASAKGAVPLDAFMKDLDGASGRLLIRIPKSLHKRLKAEAEREGVSVNQYITYKLAN